MCTGVCRSFVRLPQFHQCACQLTSYLVLVDAIGLLLIKIGFIIVTFCCAFQTPVTWQPNADGSLMIGHMILLKQSGSRSSGDVLGLKVVGGKRTESGRLGAFVTKVKRGSVADTVGHLKPGEIQLRSPRIRLRLAFVAVL